MLHKYAYVILERIFYAQKSNTHSFSMAHIFIIVWNVTLFVLICDYIQVSHSWQKAKFIELNLQVFSTQGL